MSFTDAEYQDLGLTSDEIDAMSDLGYEINQRQNVRAIDDLAAYYEKAGLDDEADRIRSLRGDTITYMQNKVYDVTGWAIGYNEDVGQFYKLGGQGETSGQFVGYMNFDRTLTNDAYEQAIVDKIGYYEL